MKASEFCEKWGTTHQQLADLLGVGRTTVTAWINGDRPEGESTERLLKMWDTDFERLLLLQTELSPALSIFEECRAKGKGKAFKAD